MGTIIQEILAKVIPILYNHSVMEKRRCISFEELDICDNLQCLASMFSEKEWSRMTPNQQKEVLEVMGASDREEAITRFRKVSDILAQRVEAQRTWNK